MTLDDFVRMAGPEPSAVLAADTLTGTCDAGPRPSAVQWAGTLVGALPGGQQRRAERVRQLAGDLEMLFSSYPKSRTRTSRKAM